MAIDKSYYTIITNVGKAKIANASVTGNKVGFVKIQLGDGGGVSILLLKVRQNLKMWYGKATSEIQPQMKLRQTA
ncbi:phage tail-collar fiber family protein [Clostridioides difficile CD160]|nr:phage tail-collar fiber family protein [Clostridioides difficile CD160]